MYYRYISVTIDILTQLWMVWLKIKYPTQKIKNKSILIFDDSIHHGDSARKILNSLISIGYTKILFLTVISQKDSLNALKKDYSTHKNIEFLQCCIKDEKEYEDFYARYMIGYLDHVNRSLENDHILMKLKIDTLIEKDSFMDL